MNSDIRFKFSEFFGTICYVGHIPFAPGTFGSLVALIAWYYLKPFLSDPLFLLITGAIFFFGIVVTDILITVWDDEDPKQVVIDEWVGMWISLYLVPHSIKWGLIAFLLFRIFDIFKPGPVQAMDDMHDATGVMMDDVVAGVLTCLLTQSLLYFKF
jgi:phosphatidylglycerophosphatase A